MHPSKRAQIVYLKVDEAPTKVPSKYADFAKILLSKLAVELSEYTKVDNPVNELVDDWQFLYSLIYSLKPMDLENLKTYIKNNLTNDFIRPSKSSVKIIIFFNKKSDGSLKLCVSYYSLYNLTMKN